MSDMGETFAAMKEAAKAHRARMLAAADTTGWTKHTDHHFSRTFGKVRVEWWPSGGKAKVGSRMVYGHKRVEQEIKKLMNAEGAAQ